MNIKLLGLLLVVSSTLFVSESFSAEITLDESKQYGPGDIVELSGKLENGVEGDLVAIEVKSPSGDTLVIRTVTLGPGGSYYLKFKIPESAEAGTYDISVKGDEPETVTTSSPTSSASSSEGGCLIATAAFGSEMAPQVQFLREIRDNTVMSTQSGQSFMSTFNAFYYSFSPTVADWERQNPAFKETVRITITPLISSLSLLKLVDIDSEAEMLGYGVGIILLNIGMYFVAPAFFVIKLRSSFKKQV